MNVRKGATILEGFEVTEKVSMPLNNNIVCKLYFADEQTLMTQIKHCIKYNYLGNTMTNDGILEETNKI